MSTNHKKLLAWVAEVEAMCQPDRVEWADGSQAEYDRLMQLMVDIGHGDQAERGEASQQLPVPQRSERRGPRRGPHVHRLRERGGRRPDQQLDRSGRVEEDDDGAVHAAA